MPEVYDILIVGGGIAGVSLAARLAPHAKVALAEAEEHLGTQTTARSAAILVEAYEKPEIRRLTKRSRDFFETPPKGFSDAPLSARRGVMVYGGVDDLPKLRDEFDLAGRTTTVQWYDAAAVAERCPLLKSGVAAAGFLEPNALQLDASALLQGFARTARAHGAEIHTAAPVRSIARGPESWEVEAGSHTIACAILVNASGAWVDEVAALAGIRRRNLRPMRRTAATLPVPEAIARILPTHPFMIPVDGSFYFKPETGSIMVSLSEETPSEPCDAYPEELDVALALERFHDATIVPRARPSATWAGLRTFTSDRLPVVGFDPEAEGFFWYAGQGGTGIQTSPAHSALAAKLVLRQDLDTAESEIAAAFRCDRPLPAWP